MTQGFEYSRLSTAIDASEHSHIVIEIELKVFKSSEIYSCELL